MQRTWYLHNTKVRYPPWSISAQSLVLPGNSACAMTPSDAATSTDKRLTLFSVIVKSTSQYLFVLHCGQLQAMHVSTLEPSLPLNSLVSRACWGCVRTAEPDPCLQKGLGRGRSAGHAFGVGNAPGMVRDTVREA